MDEGFVACPSCGQLSLRGKRFCADCGASLLLVCPSCGAEALLGKRFCADCGTPLAGALPARPAPPPHGAVAPAGPERSKALARAHAEYALLAQVLLVEIASNEGHGVITAFAKALKRA